MSFKGHTDAQLRSMLAALKTIERDSRDLDLRCEARREAEAIMCEQMARVRAAKVAKAAP